MAACCWDRFWLMAETCSPNGKSSHAGRSPLAVYRFSQGHSQGSLAELAGICRATVNNIETGRHQPTLKTARAIAHVLDIDPAALWPEDHGT